MIFSAHYEDILDKIHRIDPINYGHSRNYLNGSVTYLSPYISRGVISTKLVLETVIAKGHSAESIEKFIQELAWRDYWQLQWISHGNSIDHDLKQQQPKAVRKGIPNAILNHTTGIAAIDACIQEFYKTGYLHNHVRMYIASIACNVGQRHWHVPARWMYYHLLDGDWASNALSWQWVCGANSQKLYYANQDNINKYCETNQHNTFLDVAYEDFDELPLPDALLECIEPDFITPLPASKKPSLDPNKPTLIYNYYNLDPLWHKDEHVNRILLLEPSVFAKYPVSQKSIDFCIELAIKNIPNIQIWVAEFDEVQSIARDKIYFKEHPLNKYEGIEESRAWLSNVKGNFPSFFTYWKKCKKEWM